MFIDLSWGWSFRQIWCTYLWQRNGELEKLEPAQDPLAVRPQSESADFEQPYCLFHMASLMQDHHTLTMYFTLVRASALKSCLLILTVTLEFILFTLETSGTHLLGDETKGLWSLFQRKSSNSQPRVLVITHSHALTINAWNFRTLLWASFISLLQAP